MASKPIRNGSGSEGDPNLVTDDRKRKRMLSNRESARRSRMRKQQHLDELVNQAAQLQHRNMQIEMQVNVLTQHFDKVDYENSILRAQVFELTDRLRSLNSVLHVIQEVSGLAVDIPEVPDVLEPWQLPCPAQPITATADMFQF